MCMHMHACDRGVLNPQLLDMHAHAAILRRAQLSMLGLWITIGLQIGLNQPFIPIK
jgi:hypothetical protein